MRCCPPRLAAFRFWGVAYAKLSPIVRGVVRCRRLPLPAVGCCWCCHRCCQPCQRGVGRPTDFRDRAYQAPDIRRRCGRGSLRKARLTPAHAVRVHLKPVAGLVPSLHPRPRIGDSCRYAFTEKRRTPTRRDLIARALPGRTHCLLGGRGSSSIVTGTAVRRASGVLLVRIIGPLARRCWPTSGLIVLPGCRCGPASGRQRSARRWPRRR